MNRTGFVVVRGTGVVLLGLPWLLAACGGLVPSGLASSGVSVALADGGTCCPDDEPDCSCSVAVAAGGGTVSGEGTVSGGGPVSGGGTVTEVGCACPSDEPDCTCTTAVDAGGGASSVVCSCSDNGACACSMVVPADAGGGATNPLPPACPPGWQAPEGSPYLCCQTDADGIIDCFAQGWSGSGEATAGGGVTTVAVDASAGPAHP